MRFINLLIFTTVVLALSLAANTFAQDRRNPGSRPWNVPKDARQFIDEHGNLTYFLAKRASGLLDVFFCTVWDAQGYHALNDAFAVYDSTLTERSIVELYAGHDDASIFLADGEIIFPLESDASRLVYIAEALNWYGGKGYEEPLCPVVIAEGERVSVMLYYQQLCADSSDAYTDGATLYYEAGSDSEILWQQTGEGWSLVDAFLHDFDRDNIPEVILRFEDEENAETYIHRLTVENDQLSLTTISLPPMYLDEPSYSLDCKPFVVEKEGRIRFIDHLNPEGEVVRVAYDASGDSLTWETSR